jgi:FKBP-type peptidyl-prolyl cis-trans isomerase
MQSLASLILATAIVLACGPGERPRPTGLASEDEKANYSVGYQIGADFERQGIPLEVEALVAGIEDAFAGGEALLSEEDRRQVLVDLRRRAVEAEQAGRQVEAEKNLAAAKTFMEANRAKEGVQALPSGLQYKVLAEGSGPKPAATDTVTVHYRGKLIDGTEFDSSYSRNEPATFALNRVIPGWTEALQLMGEGSKWELYIPPDLGYGERGAGSRIPPQSALVFEVELLQAKAK